jgi:hypothetical protein
VTTTTDVEMDVLRGRLRRPGRYLSVCPRETILTGTVTEVRRDSVKNGIYEIVIGTITGTQLYQGITLDIGTTPGSDDIGRIRCRQTRAVIGATLAVPVNHTSLAELPVTVGNFVTARMEFLPWQISYRLEEITDSGGDVIGMNEYFDYDINMNNPHLGIPPKANILEGVHPDLSPKFAKLADWEESPGLGYRDISFTTVYSHSMLLDHNITTVQWYFLDDCTILGGGSVYDEFITLRVPVGFRYIALWVTDGEYEAYMWMPLWTHSDSYMPYEIENIIGDTTESDRELQVEFFGQFNEASPTNLPRRTTICYWEDNVPAVKAYRDCVLGWAYEEAARLQYPGGTYLLRIGTIQYWLDHFDGPTQVLRDPHETPDRAFELRNLDLENTMTFQLWALSTAPQIVNFIFESPLSNSSTDEVEFPPGTLWTQMQEVASRFEVSLVGCDSLSNLWFTRDYQHLSDDEKAEIPPILHLLAVDIGPEGMDLIRRRTPEVAQVDGAGSIFIDELDDDGFRKYVLYASVGPGKVKAPGTSYGKLPGQYLENTFPQNDLNILTNQRWAYLNREFTDGPVELVDNYDVVEPCWQKPIMITWQEPTVHGTQLVSSLFIVLRVEIQHSFEVSSSLPPKRITWTVQRSLSEEPGESVPADTEDDTPQLPDTEVPIPMMPGLRAGIGTIAVFFGDRYLSITHDFGSTLPTWTNTDLSASLASGYTIFQFIVDAFSPLYVGTGTSVDGWLFCNPPASPPASPQAARIYRIVDVFGAHTITLQFTATNTRTAFTGVQLERGVHGWGIATMSELISPAFTRQRMKCVYSMNGTTWTEVLLAEPAASQSVGAGAVHVSPHIPGHGYTLIQGTGFSSGLYETHDYGATWTLLDSAILPNSPNYDLHVPYQSTDDSIIYYLKASGNVGPYKRVVGTDTDLTPSGVGTGLTNFFGRFGLKTCDINQNSMAFAIQDQGSYVSANAGVAWTQVDPPGGVRYASCNIAGDDADVSYWWGDTGHIGYRDTTGTIVSKRGIGGPSAIHSASGSVNICGGAS